MERLAVDLRNRIALGGKMVHPAPPPSPPPPRAFLSGGSTSSREKKGTLSVPETRSCCLFICDHKVRKKKLFSRLYGIHPSAAYLPGAGPVWRSQNKSIFYVSNLLVSLSLSLSFSLSLFLSMNGLETVREGNRWSSLPPRKTGQRRRETNLGVASPLPVSQSFTYDKMVSPKWVAIC